DDEDRHDDRHPTRGRNLRAANVLAEQRRDDELRRPELPHDGADDQPGDESGEYRHHSTSAVRTIRNARYGRTTASIIAGTAIPESLSAKPTMPATRLPIRPARRPGTRSSTVASDPGRRQ